LKLDVDTQVEVLTDVNHGVMTFKGKCGKIRPDNKHCKPGGQYEGYKLVKLGSSLATFHYFHPSELRIV